MTPPIFTETGFATPATVAGNPRERLQASNIVPEGWESVPAGRQRFRPRPRAGENDRPGAAPRRALGGPAKACLVAAVLLGAALLLFSACGQAFSSVSSGGKGLSVASLLGGANDTPSTPKAEWVQGELPYLYQTDAQWKNTAYAGGTIADSGCGPTCLAMVYVGVTGKKDHSPVTLAAFSESAGYVYGGMTSWTYMTEGAQALGLHSRELPADHSVIAAALQSGQPVIASMAPGTFTDVGHFIVLCGVEDDGSIEIRDPNSPERSHKTWSLDQIIPEARNFWAFS